MSLTKGKRKSLADQLREDEKALEVELAAVSKAKMRAVKEGKKEESES